MSTGKHTSDTGDSNVLSQQDPQLQSQGQGPLDQPTRDTGYGDDTTQGRFSDKPGYGDRTTAQHHHLHRSDDPITGSPATGAGQDTSPTQGRDTTNDFGTEGQHLSQGESRGATGTVPGTSFPAGDDTGDVRRGASHDVGGNRGHEGPIGRHEERKEARREQDIGAVGGAGTRVRNDEGEGPLERHEERKEGRHEGGGTGVTGKGHHHHHEGPIERHEERKEARREEGTGTGTHLGTGGIGYGDTGRGVHAQQYERHPGEHLAGERRAGQGLGPEGQNVEAQQAATEGTGGVGAGFGNTQHTGAGPGTGQGKVSTTDKVIGGGEKLAGKLTSKPGLYEQGQQRQHGLHEPQPKQ